MQSPLNNPEVYPDDGVLSQNLKRAKSKWDEFLAGLAEKFPEVEHEWRYYKDGKAWLCKVVRKKKTVCWISVWDNYFKAGFYFTDKFKDDIEALDIAQEIKDIYLNHKGFGKLKPLIFEITEGSDLDDLFKVIQFKISCK